MAKTRREAIEIGGKVIKSMGLANPLRIQVCELVEYIESTLGWRAGSGTMEAAAVAEISRLAEKLAEVTKQRDALQAHLDRLTQPEKAVMVDEHS